MGFKMKGPSIIQGSQRHASALKTAMDDALAKGKAQMQAPSPAKAKTEEVKTGEIKWGPEKKVKTTVTKDKGTTTTKTDYETKGTSKGDKVEKQATTPEEIAAYKKYQEGVKKGTVKRNTRYDDKTHIKKRSELDRKTDLIKIKPKKVKLVDKKDKDPEPVKPTGRYQREYERNKKRQEFEKKREKNRKYDVVEEKTLFKKRKIKSRKTGRVTESGRSKFGDVVSAVTGRDKVKPTSIRKAKRAQKKRNKNQNCKGNLCKPSKAGGIKTKMN